MALSFFIGKRLCFVEEEFKKLDERFSYDPFGL